MLLSIDTSTRGCSVALHQDTTLLACNEIFTDKSSAEMLTTLIANVVAQAKATLNDVDAIAVAKGPGSYTGLRIAVSTAKGLCFALEKPLIAVNTLSAMALQVRHFYDENHCICPMIDARRMEVFCAIFDTNLAEIASTQAKIITEDSFVENLLAHKMVFVGDGAAKCQVVLGHHANAIFPQITITPSAKTIGTLAHELFLQKQFEDIETFEPFYLKEFMATTPRT